MATLATAYSRHFIKDAAVRASSSRANIVKPVRAFPNEDIYLYVKRIDNSRLVRAKRDSEKPCVCWKTIGSVGAAAPLLIGVPLPSATGCWLVTRSNRLLQPSAQWASKRRVAGSQDALSGAHGRAGAPAAVRRSGACCVVSGFEGRLFAGAESEAVDGCPRGSHVGKLNWPGACAGCCGPCCCGRRHWCSS